MNMNKRRIAGAMPVLLVVAMTLASCATVTKGTTGIERAEKTTTSMQTVESDLKQASVQIDSTNTALNDLIRTGQSASPPADVKKSYETYSEDVAKMEDIGKTLNKHIDQMNSQGNAYFEEWEKTGGTYTNPELQRLSAEQRVRLSRPFTDISTASAGMRGQLNAYLSELRQIRTYLSNDLTASGISAVASVADDAIRNGDSLRSSFSPVQTAINRARVELTPGGAAAGGTTTK
jgi:hypothetical protein